MKKLILASAILASVTSISANAAWSIQHDSDEFTGVTTYYAASDWTKPSKRLGFPLNKLESAIAVGCDTEGSFWTYTVFNYAPNLVGDTAEDGYSSSSRRVKFGKGETKELTFLQTWGSKSLSVYGESSKKFVINGLLSESSALVDFSDWYNQPNFTVKYRLNGSTKAISSILAKCGIKKSEVTPRVVKPYKKPEYKVVPVSAYPTMIKMETTITSDLVEKSCSVKVIGDRVKNEIAINKVETEGDASACDAVKATLGEMMFLPVNNEHLKTFSFNIEF